MSRLTESERLVKLETQVDAVLVGITEIKADNKEFRDKLDGLLPEYATKSQLQSLRKEIKRKSFIQNTLSAILGSVLTLLIAFFITNVGR